MSPPCLHHECECYAPGTFFRNRDFRLALLNLIAKGQQGAADDLLNKAHVFDQYVYVFHSGDKSSRSFTSGVIQEIAAKSLALDKSPKNFDVCDVDQTLNLDIALDMADAELRQSNVQEFSITEKEPHL